MHTLHTKKSPPAGGERFGSDETKNLKPVTLFFFILYVLSVRERLSLISYLLDLYFYFYIKFYVNAKK